MRVEHVGQIFNRPIQLSLVPGLDLPSSYYQVHIQYTTELNTATINHNSAFVSTSKLNIIMGNDVRSITVLINDLNRAHTYYHYTIRVDHLILLNLAEKLIKTL